MRKVKWVVVDIVLIITLVITLFVPAIYANNTNKNVSYDSVVYLDNNQNDKNPSSLTAQVDAGLKRASYCCPVPIEQFMITDAYASLDEATHLRIEEKLNKHKKQKTEQQQRADDVLLTIEDASLVEKYGIKFIPSKEAPLNEYRYDISQSNEPTRTTCDLYVSGLSCSLGSKPIPINKSTTFSFAMGNNGSVGAVGTILLLYVDVGSASTYIGLLTFGTFPANYNQNFAIALTFGLSWQGGSKVLRLEAQTSTPDSNLGNNTTSKSFIWQNNLDLAVYTLLKSPGPAGKMTGTSPYSFSFDIVNFGLDNTATKTYALVEVRDFASGSLLYNDKLYLPTLKPGQKVNVQFPVQVNRSGVYKINAIAGDDVNDDTDPDDNVIWDKYTCIPDGCGTWFASLACDKTDIRISVNDTKITLASVQSAANQWNGISSHINISSVGEYLPISTCTIVSGPVANSSGGLFTPSLISLSDYIGGIIIINNAPHGSGAWFDRYVLVHEIGHLVSLHHPHEANPICADYAAMQYDTKGLWSDTVTEHDKIALRNKWGN